MKINRILFLLLVILSFSCTNQNNTIDKYEITGSKLREGNDPYLSKLYWSLNDAPMQQKLRNVKPFPVGVVYYQQRGDNMDSVKKEFSIIKKLGFTSLKQVQLVAPNNPVGFEEQVFHAALDAGITPWYYGMGGWAKITPELLKQLNINLDLTSDNLEAIENHPAMQKYQMDIMRERIAKMKNKPERPKGIGEPGRNNPWMPERLIPYFAKWLEKEYKTIDVLKEAWNDGFNGKCDFSDFNSAAKVMQGEGFDKFGSGTGKIHHDFRRFRDAMRFQADLIVENYVETMDMYHKWDSLEPERTGGHQIFENQASNTWDLEGQAKSAAVGGSFYSSIHLAHHFFLVNNEITRPVYMQARIVSDMFKGGWAAVWESTGGPTQFSGYSPFTVTENTMRQLMMQYVAAGLKGIGLWMWNSRGEGWEIGEYALCDIQGQPGPRAKMAGHISSILQKQRFELWEAMDEPVVGILNSWENEAIWARMGLGAYPLNTAVMNTDWDKQFRQYHSQAKAGISRALMNNNIPFEYVTERDLNAGLAQRYPVIFLPSVIALDEKTLDILIKYVEDGGRLVADLPLLYMDNYGRLNKQRQGSKFEKLFGFQVAEYYHTHNSAKSLLNENATSYFGDIKLTHATIIDKYNDGTPSVITSNYGKGTTTVFNFEAGRMVFAPGKTKLEKMISFYTLGENRPQFNVKGTNNSYVFRRAAPKADHYFIINDGEKHTITISSDVLKYTSASELIDNTELKIMGNKFDVTIPAHSAIWVRCIK